MSDPTINEWVSAALEGDQDAFADLVYAFQDAVYNLCYRMLGERMEAEGVAFPEDDAGRLAPDFDDQRFGHGSLRSCSFSGGDEGLPPQ